MRLLLLTLAAVSLVSAQNQFISFHDPVIALLHVRVIDGTGSPARPDQTIVLDHGKIASVGDASKLPIPPGARALDLSGATVYPGLIGMHEHLFYPAPGGRPLIRELMVTGPILYLASGVTTMRTAGSIEPYTDLNIKDLIDKGVMIGPDIDVTGPYIQGPGGFFLQMPVIHTPEEARRFVDYWAAAGVTSFKAYMNISHDALAAAIQTAHRHGLKITGHLCSVGFTEAAELGIDDLEHGLLVDTEFTPGKQRDVCPGQHQGPPPDKLDSKGPEIKQMIHQLVANKVAITSTLAVFEAMIPGRPPSPSACAMPCRPRPQPAISPLKSMPPATPIHRSP